MLEAPSIHMPRSHNYLKAPLIHMPGGQRIQLVALEVPRSIPVLQIIIFQSFEFKFEKLHLEQLD